MVALFGSFSISLLALFVVGCTEEGDGGAPATANGAGAGGASGAGTGGSAAGAGVGGQDAGAGAGGIPTLPPPPTGSVAPVVECSTDAQCLAKLPETTPAGCATAACVNDVCTFGAGDADHDGAPTRFCKSKDPAFVLALGGDCNDADAAIHPGAWDGPAADGQPDRCGDGVDQDCSGADGDSIASSGQSCECTAGDVASCDNEPSGKAIAFPGGMPVGECKRGSHTCVVDVLTGGGKWGPCVGAVAPAVEECNGKDDDCDGSIDEEALDRTTFTCDADADNHLAPGAATVLACFAPTEGCPGKWQDTAPVDDCDDKQSLTFLGRSEQCDGLDNDCDGQVDDGFACSLGSLPVAATTCPGGAKGSDVPCKRFCDSVCGQGACLADQLVTGKVSAADQIAGTPCGAGCGDNLAIVGPGLSATWKVALPPGKYRIVFDIDSSAPTGDANVLGAMIAESKAPASVLGARANSWFNFRTAEQGGAFTIDLPIDACGQDTLFSIYSSTPATVGSPAVPGPKVLVHSVSWQCVEGACMTTPAPL
jgi:hypothetical protein